MKLGHEDVPVHSVVTPLWPQPQPACAVQVVCMVKVVHAVGVPVQLVPHVQPACAMQVFCVPNEAQEVAVPPHTGVQPGHAVPQP